jgi:L-arabinose isomerase
MMQASVPYQNESSLSARVPHPRIGVLPTGHAIYWEQFPGLQARCQAMWSQFRERLQTIGTVIAPEIVDTPEKSMAAGQLFQREGIDLLLIFPLGYTTGMVVTPAVQHVSCPIRILNAHVDSTYDYARADTAEYLYHEGPCCVPEYAATLITLDKPFLVRTGHFGQQHFWHEVEADCRGAAAARKFRTLNFGVIGATYTHMTDMPTDEHRLLRATGRLLKRPEVEEIEEAFHRVTDEQLEEMYHQFRTMYDVDATVTNAHLRLSAQIAVAYDEVITRHDINAFGYYWWGEKELITQLRAQSALAVSRLAALGRPGVTEGDVKTAMAMKVLDLLGGGGMFVEFFAIDHDEEFILVGHDGPSNVNVADGRPRLQHLDVHHGKTGHGLGIDFRMRQGPVTLLNLTQFDAGDTLKLIYSVGEVVPGDILNIGNPNCRVKVQRSIPDFFNAWCQQGPCHHIALGVGDHGAEIETFAEAMGFRWVRV